MKYRFFEILFILFLVNTVISAKEADLSRLQQAGIQLLEQPVMARNFEVKDMKGKVTDLNSTRGKVVLLNFWASWCGPCKAEMPSLERLYNEFDEKDFTIFAVSSYDDPTAMTDFFKENDYTFPGYYDHNYEGTQTYGIQSIPTTFFINKKGEIVAGILGGIKWDKAEVIKTIQEMIEE